jgi:hypothetical protein
MGQVCPSINQAATVDLTQSVNQCNAAIYTPNSNTTFKAPVPFAGTIQTFTLFIVTSGTTPFTLTFGTNMNSNGTFNTGATSAAVYTIRFMSNGTVWKEIGRSVLSPGSLQQFTIANLPTCAAATTGMLAMITNGVASPTYNAAVSTTGAANKLVFCNGSAWTYH